MTKARKKPYSPPTSWDRGTGTRAQKFGLIIEDAGEIDPKTGKRVNPNGVKRARKITFIEKYRREGRITSEQETIALALNGAFEATQKSGEAIKKVQVDSSPKPDHAVSMMIERIGGYHAIAKHIPNFARQEIHQVVVENKPIEKPSMGYSDCLLAQAKLLLGLEKMRVSLNG